MNIAVDQLTIAITRHPGHAGPKAAPVIYVHGGTFPSALAVGWRFAEGRSWADDLRDAGHDLWTFDFAGFGASARYPAMAAPPTPGPLGQSDAATRQLAAVVDHVRAETGAAKVALLAHSWGGAAASRFAAEHPDRVERLVLFAPIIQRMMTGLPDASKLPGWMPMPLAAQLKRFREDVPSGEPELITDAMFETWGAAYLATDPSSTTYTPHAVAIPMGPQADIAAIWSGELAYDLTRIICPVSVVRGAWDSLCTDEDVACLKQALTSAPHFTDAKLERGTHLMHLETGRARLWTATRNALSDVKRAPIDAHAVIFEVHPSDEGRAEYLATAAALRPLLDEVDGFESIERFGSRSRPGWILSLSFWADDAAVAAWRSRERHHGAQVKGRSGVFQDYRLRVAHVRSDNAVGPDRQPKAVSTYRAPSRRAVRHIAVVEVSGAPSPALAAALRPGGGVDASETFDSLTTQGKAAHLLSFTDALAANDWRERVRSAPASTRIRTMEVLRDYGMFDRTEAPQYHPEAHRTGAPA